MFIFVDFTFKNTKILQDSSLVECLPKDLEVCGSSLCHGILLWRWALHLHLGSGMHSRNKKQTNICCLVSTTYLVKHYVLLNYYFSADSQYAVTIGSGLYINAIAVNVSSYYYIYFYKNTAVISLASIIVKKEQLAGNQTLASWPGGQKFYYSAKYI